MIGRLTREQRRHDLEVGCERALRGTPGLAVGRTQNRRRMHRGDDERRDSRLLEHLAAMRRDEERAPEQRLRGRRAEQDNDAGRIVASSASSQGRQAATSAAFGLS